MCLVWCRQGCELLSCASRASAEALPAHLPLSLRPVLSLGVSHRQRSCSIVQLVRSSAAGAVAARSRSSPSSSSRFSVLGHLTYWGFLPSVSSEWVDALLEGSGCFFLFLLRGLPGIVTGSVLSAIG